MAKPAFRRLERDIIVEMTTRERVVISTGAGSVMHDDSLGTMLASGLVVALEAHPETIYKRLSSIAEEDGAEAMVRPMLRSGGSDDPLGRIESLKRERQVGVRTRSLDGYDGRDVRGAGRARGCSCMA